MRRKLGRRTTGEKTAMAGAIFALLAGSAGAETLLPSPHEKDGARCAADRRNAEDPSGGCLRINGYIAASVDVPSAATDGRLLLNRPRALAPRVDFGPAASNPGFLPAKSDDAR